MSDKKRKEGKQEPELPTRNGIPESIKQRKRLGKKADFSEYFDLKLEVAEELGLLDKVKKYGWGALSTKESGRLGGYMTRVLKSDDGTEKNNDGIDPEDGG